MKNDVPPRFPLRLKPGDTIGVVAPSSPCAKEEILKGRDILENWGLKVLMPAPLQTPEGYLAASDQARAEQFTAMFLNPEVKAIFATRGGYGAGRILPLLPWRKLKVQTKLFLGFSDTTFLLLAGYRKLNQAVIHGPHIGTLGHLPEDNLAWLKNLLFRKQNKKYSLPKGRGLRAGRAQGRVLGGNLTSLAHMVGTPYLPDFKRHILFLEDRGEKLYRLDRALIHLKQAGVLNGIVGLALGSFMDCGAYSEVEVLFRSLTEELEIPLTSGLPCGHGVPHYALPFGVQAELDGKKGTLTFLDAGTK